MNDDPMLKTLGKLARQEAIPKVEVSFRVMRRIEETRQPTNAPMAALAGLSAAAAAIVLFYAADAWTTWQDPIAGLLYSMDTVMQ